MSEHEQHGDKTITIKKADLWKYTTFVLIAVIVIWGIMHFSGGSSGSTDTGTDNQAPINAKALIDSNDPVLGDKNAGITVIEFSDFQCPFCERAFSDAIASLKASDMFKNGEINLIYKQLPLDTTCNSGMSQQLHPYACKAAEASLCADKQGKFWEMHDKLFMNQAALTSTLQTSNLAGVTAAIKQYASQLGLNTASFNSCLDKGDTLSEVKKEIAQATSAGGSGTPFFVIVNNDNGDATSISGAYPWSQFQTAIDSIK